MLDRSHVALIWHLADGLRTYKCSCLHAELLAANLRANDVVHLKATKIEYGVLGVLGVQGLGVLGV